MKQKIITFDGIKDLHKAKDLLAKAEQRPRRSSQIKKLAEKMIKGVWKERMDPPMVLTKTNILKAGQHRIAAWIEAVQVMQTLKISFDLKYDVADADAYAAQCDEAAITAKDSLLISGKNGDIGPALKLFVNRGQSMGKPIAEEINEAADKYEDYILFAINALKGRNTKKVASAFVVAAVARAYCVEGRKHDLQEFCNILVGNATPNSERDRFPNELARELLSKKAPRSAGEVHTAYRRTEFAIRSFFNDVPFEKLKNAKQEEFLLPNEQVTDDSGSAFLIPLIGCAKRPVEDMLKSLHSRQRTPIYRIRWRRMQPGSKVAFFTPKDGKILAQAIFQGMDKNAANDPVMLVSEPTAVSEFITPQKLIQTSLSKKKIPNLAKIGQQVTKVSERDLSILLASKS